MRFLLISYFLTWVFIPWILLARKRPESTLAWIWAILLFPFLGPIAYLLFGVDRVTCEAVLGALAASLVLAVLAASPVVGKPSESGILRLRYSY